MKSKWINAREQWPTDDRYVLALELYGSDPPYQPEYYIAWYSVKRNRWVADSTGEKVTQVAWWCELPKSPEDE
jgi:hypothetical protein